MFLKVTATAFLILHVLQPCFSAWDNFGEDASFGSLYRWKQMDFEYPTQQLRQEAVSNGQFVQRNVIPLGIERWRDRVFVSTPKWKSGVPATLSVLPATQSALPATKSAPPPTKSALPATKSALPATESKHRPSKSALPTVPGVESPPLRPYPSWDWHNAVNCTGFTSVFRMAIDHCGVMWVLDWGGVEAFETPRQVCPPAVYAIDLNTDTVLVRIQIPQEYILENSLITNIIVDSRDARCRDRHLYIADAWRYGLIVFRTEDAKFWKFTHYTFYPEPLLSNYTLHGLNYQWSDGLFGMSLGKVSQGDRPLYYHSMSGSNEYVVMTSVLRDPARVNNAVGEFKLLGESRGAGGQVTGAAVDRSGVMFYALISRDSIGCWNTNTTYSSQSLAAVARNTDALVFPNDLRIDHEVQQLVWFITNRLPMYQFNLINPLEYNYRVMFLNPEKAVKNTVCSI